MHDRYEKRKIAVLFSDEKKLLGWQDTELAVIEAAECLGKFPPDTHGAISDILNNTPIDIAWWKSRDKEIRHDLNAFVDERLRHLPTELQEYFHKKITSFDTEEPAFALTLLAAVAIVEETCTELDHTLVNLAVAHRYTIMNARTHGQEAELQSFGKRVLGWRADLLEDRKDLLRAKRKLRYSKITGAIGNYGAGLNPKLERMALDILGLEPYHGATQIIPREIYLPVAEALGKIVGTLNKIALSIRLGARSGRPIFQEPFAAVQKGSSAMPHKKNTIGSEQIEGMDRMAKGYVSMIRDNISTWEERAIEQSCVERVAWPDLFHVTLHSLEKMNEILKGLKVYPDNMLQEIVESRGCYASSEAKEFIKERGKAFGLTSDEGYRIIQLGAFLVFEIPESRKPFRENLPKNLKAADKNLECFDRYLKENQSEIQHLREIIPEARLRITPQLAAAQQDVDRWNEILGMIFSDDDNLAEWKDLFLPSTLLKNEAFLFKKILRKK